MIKNNLNNLKETDIYSIILFALFKLIPIPEYSSISQLAYVLDKDNLLNLCENFGGQTIKIPTISELENLVWSLLLYQYVDIEHMEYNTAIELIGHESKDLRSVKTNYHNIKQVLMNYQFNVTGAKV